jgi:hypothetical protein
VKLEGSQRPVSLAEAGISKEKIQEEMAGGYQELEYLLTIRMKMGSVKKAGYSRLNHLPAGICNGKGRGAILR